MSRTQHPTVIADQAVKQVFKDQHLDDYPNAGIIRVAMKTAALTALLVYLKQEQDLSEQRLRTLQVAEKTFAKAP